MESDEKKKKNCWESRERKVYHRFSRDFSLIMRFVLFCFVFVNLFYFAVDSSIKIGVHCSIFPLVSFELWDLLNA